MSKKLEKFLETESTALLEQSSHLKEEGTPKNIITMFLSDEIEDAAKKLLNEQMGNLKTKFKTLTEFQRTYESFLSRNPGDEEYINKSELTQFQLAILRKAIDEKQAYYDSKTHEMESNLISHGVFSPTSKAKKQKETIRFEKNGFKKLYYSNSNGVILTNYDLKVLSGLIKLWLSKDEPKALHFELAELAQSIFAEPTGGNYKNLYQSIQNLYATDVVMEEYYQGAGDNSTTLFSDHQVRLITYLKGDGEVVINQKLAKKYYKTVTLNMAPWLTESIKEGNSIMYNMVLLNDFEKPTTGSLYTYLINAINETTESHIFLDIDKLIEHFYLDKKNRSKTLNILRRAFEELVTFNVILGYNEIKKGNRYQYFEVKIDRSRFQTENQLETSPGTVLTEVGSNFQQIALALE